MKSAARKGVGNYVANLNNNPEYSVPFTYPDPKNPKRQIKENRKAVPETWGATLTLTLTAEEMTGFNPSLALNQPLHPLDTRFPDGVVVAGPQSFNLGLGGKVSSDATRFDKYTFFYKVKSLEVYSGACESSVPKDDSFPSKFKGSSLLLESDLGIERWLIKMIGMRTGIGTSDKSDQQVLTYDVKFDVVTSGSVTPTWKLTPVTTATGGLPLLSMKRERTHEMLLTLGPLDEKKSAPGALATSDALASQIGAAVGAAVRGALSRQQSF